MNPDKSAPVIDDRDWHRLTLGERIRQLEIEGYVVLPDLLDADHIARLKAQTATFETTPVDYSIHQRGRTVALSLVVPADTPADTARALGERFVMLVKTLALTETAPDDEIGVGDYDYIVQVSSPSDSVIARGGKATADTKIHW